MRVAGVVVRAPHAGLAEALGRTVIARPGGIGAGARAVAIGFVVIGGCTSAEPSEPTGPSLDSGPADAGDVRDARGIDAGAVDAGARDGGGTPDA